jgi:HEAT repeat protein
VAVFAKANLDNTLRAVKTRHWNDLRIAHSGIASVPDPKVLPYLLSMFASRDPTDRTSAVNYLALHRDPRAIDTLIAALKDRSSGVRSAAISALGKVGDSRALKPLSLVAKRSAEHQRSAWLAQSAQEAIAKIRKTVREPR